RSSPRAVSSWMRAPILPLPPLGTRPPPARRRPPRRARMTASSRHRPPTDLGGPMRSRRRTGRRLAITVLAVFALVGVFIVRLVDIQVVQAEALTKAADARQEFTVPIYGSRGE